MGSMISSGNGTPTIRPGRLWEAKPFSGKWRGCYCRCCGEGLAQFDRYAFPLAAGLAQHLEANRECRDYYAEQQRRLAGPRNILLETLHVDRIGGHHSVMGLDIDGNRLSLERCKSRAAAIGWVDGQLEALYRFVERKVNAE